MKAAISELRSPRSTLPYSDSTHQRALLLRQRGETDFSRLSLPMIQHPAQLRRIATRGLILSACFAMLPLTSFAMEIAADYHVPFTPENAIIGYFSPTKKPVIKVKSGSTVKIDGGGGYRGTRIPTPPTPAANGAPVLPMILATPEEVNAMLKENNLGITVESTPALTETMHVMKETPRAPGIANGHLLVGPIYIEDAEPGDSLEI